MRERVGEIAEIIFLKDKLNESFEHWTPSGGEHGKKEKSAGKPVKDVLIVEWAHQI